MAEAEALAGKPGVELPISIDPRMTGAEKVGAHTTSMLQDYEAGRPMELEAGTGAVVERYAGGPADGELETLNHVEHIEGCMRRFEGRER